MALKPDVLSDESFNSILVSYFKGLLNIMINCNISWVTSLFESGNKYTQFRSCQTIKLLNSPFSSAS